MPAPVISYNDGGEGLKPRLQGHRLINGQYVRLELAADRLHSEQLGLDLVMEGEDLRLYDPVKGEFLPTTLEMARRAEDAEAEIARLRAELAAFKSSIG